MNKIILDAIVAELKRQEQQPGLGTLAFLRIDDDELNCVTIDGYVDLEELANAIERVLPIGGGG